MSAREAMAQRLEGLRRRIDAATARAPAESAPRLIAVSKRHPSAAIETAYQLGLRDFGENYAQEFRDKERELAAQPSYADLRWHFIGSLQRNKIKYVIGRALIHTVDRVALVDALESKAADAGCLQSLLVEVNAGEAAKAGVLPEGLSALLDHIAGCPHLRCEGLMTMAPLGGAERAAQAFADLAGLRAREQARGREGMPLRELSMGMSGDFESAIEAGATMIRIGTAIFGERPG